MTLSEREAHVLRILGWLCLKADGPVGTIDVMRASGSSWDGTERNVLLALWRKGLVDRVEQPAGRRPMWEAVVR